MWFPELYPDTLYFGGNPFVKGYLAKPSISVNNDFGGNNAGVFEEATKELMNALSSVTEQAINLYEEGNTFVSALDSTRIDGGEKAKPGESEERSIARNLAGAQKQLHGEVNKKFKDTTVSGKLNFKTYIINDLSKPSISPKAEYERILERICGTVLNSEEILVINSPNNYVPATDSDYEYTGNNVFSIQSAIYGEFRGLLIQKCDVEYSETICTNGYPAYIGLSFSMMPAKRYDIRMVEGILN